MSRYVTVEIDVMDAIGEIDDTDLIDELNDRGYRCLPDHNKVDKFDREDWEFLIAAVDKCEQTWYTRRVREKLLEARFS